MAKSTRLIDHNQLLMTKIGRILCLRRKLNIRKACGYDSISPRMLRLASSGIADSLTKLFNECIRKGEWPEAWKKGVLEIIGSLWRENPSRDLKN